MKLTELKPFEVAGFDIVGTPKNGDIWLSGGTILKGGWPEEIELNTVTYTLENVKEYSESGKLQYAIYV